MMETKLERFAVIAAEGLMFENWLLRSENSSDCMNKMGYFSEKITDLQN